MISAYLLSHSFGSREVLRQVSFRLAAGEFAFVTGPSGAGKTTLLRLLHGELPLQQGKVLVAGHDLNRLESGLPGLRRDVAVIFQDFKILLKRTVYDNVSLPLEVRGLGRAQIKRRVDSVLGQLAIGHLADQACIRLAGGEQQRVAIARAMVGGPKVILADEPTGNLDWDLAAQLMEVFKQFHAHGATILMATHNREIVRSTPQARVLRLEDGALRGGEEDFGEGFEEGPGL